MTTCLKVRRTFDGPVEDVFVDGPASRWVDDEGKPRWDPFLCQYMDILSIGDEIVVLETAIDVPNEEQDR